jgi:allantoinase
VLRSRRVVFPDHVRPASLLIESGTIAQIADHHDLPRETIDLLDFGDLVVSPGIVDTHVHVNEPGRTEWEGFETATRAAAAGGITTIVDMPLNSIPATTTVAALEAKRAAARGKCSVDVAFWGGVVPGNASELEALVEAGVRGFKCFLVPSGVDEFQSAGEDDLRAAMPVLARLGVPLLVHAESPEIIERWQPTARATPVDPSVYDAYLATRPPEAEVDAIRLMTRLAREFGTDVHIVHVAAAEAVAEISRARSDDVTVTAETCPHYLTFAAEEIPDGATELKCAPPIRDGRHREALWDALHRGILDLVATDHSPAPPAMKCRGDFLRAWGGIASLELSLAAMCTGLTARCGVRSSAPASVLTQLAEWMSAAPARLARLDRKGRIETGQDADFVVWDPDVSRSVDSARLQQRHKLTPYDGHRLRGVVHATFVGGVCVWDGERFPHAGAGCLL